MAAAPHCLECQEPVPPGSPVALCGGCLIRLAEEARQEETLAQGKRHGTSLPRRFGDYQLLEQVGIGGMGIVYRAQQLSLPRIVAIKMLHGVGPMAASTLTRFRIEAEAAAMLEHPHIVSTYDAGEVDGQPYFTMRLIEGASLARRLSDYSLPGVSPGSRRSRQEKIVQLLIPVAQAVQCAHDHGVIHRDLKPNNILIDRDGKPHLGDFGVAKLLDRGEGLTRTADIIGTPHYMSPEQAMGRPVGPTSDVYSLGILLYELLTGKPPFKAASQLETLRQVMHDSPADPLKLNPSIDRDLATICLKCLEKNPLKRYGSAQSLTEDLRRWLYREPILARRSGWVDRTRRWICRNPVGSTLILTLCLGLGVSWFLMLELSRKEQALQETTSLLNEESEERRGKESKYIAILEKQLNEAWERSKENSFVITSDDLALLTARVKPRKFLKANPVNYRVGLFLKENPIVDARSYAALLTALEDGMSERLNQAVRLDLRFLKFRDEGPGALATSAADFMRFGALSYLHAEQQNPQIKLAAVGTRPGKDWVFFTRQDKPLSSLAGAAGRSLALGDTNATISFWGLMKLAEAGITASQLKKYDYLDPTPDWLEYVRQLGPAKALERVAFLHSHSKVIDAVLSDRYDLGVTSRKGFEISRHKGLVEVATQGPLLSSAVVWAASFTVKADVLKAFQDSLVELSKLPEAGSLPDAPFGYRLPIADELKEERKWLERLPQIFPPKPPRDDL